MQKTVGPERGSVRRPGPQWGLECQSGDGAAALPLAMAVGDVPNLLTSGSKYVREQWSAGLGTVESNGRRPATHQEIRAPSQVHMKN